MIHRKSPPEIALMREGGAAVAKVLRRMEEVVKPGITTARIEEEADRMARSLGIAPAFKGYNGYPAAICVSVNEEVVHGIPSSERVLAEGDIVGLDFGALYKGFYSDAAVTLPVGNPSREARRLLEVTRKALYRGIESALVGHRVGDVAFAIQSFVEENGFSVVKVFVGHGIGRSLHEEPQVPNFGEPQWGVRLKEGMTLAIEPMVNAGGDGVKVLDDGWTAVTEDGSLSAHFEHTIAVTENGPLILTMDETPRMESGN
ncbi:MAG: type I methionyl aminopeptidase [bacterium]|nr:MAG: type I methionyl aminopeptidase [bacterium]